MPFVFAVWAVAPGVELPELPFYFQSSLRYGLAVARRRWCAKPRPSSAWASAEIRDYLTQALTYVLGSGRDRRARGVLPARPRPSSAADSLTSGSKDARP